MKKSISKLYTNFLGKEQKKILEELKPFSDISVLGGGTALCMQLVHRSSYDFDLFVSSPIAKTLLNNIIKIFGKNRIETLADSSDELTVLISRQVKISFIYFPFPHLYPYIKSHSIPILYWKDIASDKAYAIGRRGEYRDYVDLFFVLEKGMGLAEIIKDAEKKFKSNFSAKLFLSQLVYFDDLSDFTIDFIGKAYAVTEIKHLLEEFISAYTRGFLAL